MAGKNAQFSSRDTLENAYDMLYFDLQILETKFAHTLRQLTRERDALLRQIGVFDSSTRPEFDLRGDSEALHQLIDDHVKQVVGVVDERVSKIKAEVNGVYLRQGSMSFYKLEDDQNGDKFVQNIQATQVEVQDLRQRLSETLAKNAALKQQLYNLQASIANLYTQKAKFALTLFEDTRNTLHAQIETDFMHVPKSDTYEETDSEQLVTDGENDDKDATSVCTHNTQPQQRRLPPLDDRLDSYLIHMHDFCKKKQAMAQANYEYLLHQTDVFLNCTKQLKYGVYQIVKKRRPQLSNVGFLSTVEVNESDRFIIMESILDEGMMDILLRLVLIDDVQFNYNEQPSQQRIGISSKMHGLRKVYQVDGRAEQGFE